MEIGKKSFFLRPDHLLFFIFVVLKLLLSLIPVQYGIFRDELYFFSMSNRPSLGFVDVPPLGPLLLAANRFLFGDSLFAMHILPAISGVLFLWIAYRLVKKLDGNNLALFLTLLGVLLAPFFVYTDNTYTYDTFNKLSWFFFSYLMIRLIQTGKPRYWIYLGIAAGFGLLFKITLLYLGLGWVIGLLLTRERKLLWRWEVLAGGALALAIFSPYLIWQFQHGFITLEYYHNYLTKIVVFSPLSYLFFQINAINPASIWIWFGGLWSTFFHPQGKLFRCAGITFLAILTISFLTHAKPDLILPFYALLLTFGAVRAGDALAKKEQRWWRVGLVSLIIAVGIFSLPMVRPLLPVPAYTRIYSSLSFIAKEEKNQTTPLPQILADRFGWEEMTAKIAEVYHSLPEADRARTCIMAGNYGEAGAIEYYGKKYNLPLPPVSGHNQYHVWGPGRFTGDIVIVVGIPRSSLMSNFKTVEDANLFSHPYIMPYENQTIYLCREPIKNFSEIKPWIKWLN